MSFFRAQRLAGLTFACGVLFAAAASPPHVALDPPRGLSVHYAPAENLERIDVALIDGARQSIDMAAYVLTNWPVMQALARASRRGVKVRIYLDNGMIGQRTPSPPFLALLDDPSIEIGVKRPGAPLMHLKSYQIDGRLLRTGAANFSASGLKKQDNDLIILNDPAAAAEFRRRFETIFAASEPLPADVGARRGFFSPQG